MSAELKKMKNTKEYGWLNDVNSQSLQQTLMHLDAAFQGFFDKVAGSQSSTKGRAHSPLPCHSTLKSRETGSLYQSWNKDVYAQEG